MYLLDANVVSYFLQARREVDLEHLAASVPCAIVDEVRRELLRDGARGARFDQWLSTSSLRVLAIEVGGAADHWLSQLEQGLTTTRGQGERASIALAATDPGLVFVSTDKGAMWIALRELWMPGERLLGLPVFLRRVVEAGAIAGDVADDVMVSSQLPRPTWWADWRAGPRVH